MEIVNLTPHIINVRDQTGKECSVVEPSGTVARVDVTVEPVGSIEEVILYRNRLEEVTGLPESKDGTFYIVSMVVRLSLPLRRDVLSPGQLLRDDEGRPVGCLGLVQN